MMNTQLDRTLKRYETAINKLSSSKIEDEEVLGILHARDAVQAALNKPKHIPSSRLKRLILSDTELRNKARAITKDITAEELQRWRESVHPPTEAWWWRLESITPYPWEHFHWLWKVFLVAGWTANISLLIDIANRFISGGGIQLFGAVAVVLPSILTLIQVSSELTKNGEEGLEKLLNKKIPKLGKKIRKQDSQAIKLGLTLLMSVFLTRFWFLLPAISDIYNQNGLQNYTQRNLGAAQQDYQRAISLNVDNIDAHYNLGNLYEEWQEIEKAKKEYQIALAGDLPHAYNNLARLYILDKKYPQAAALLTKGLLLTQNKNINPEVKYSLFKNLGWVRTLEGRNKEAQAQLQIAISLFEQTDAAKYIQHPGAAYCLMAQVLEKQKAPKALEQWQKCLQFGSTTDPDEDTWLHLAHEKLSKESK